MEEKWYSDKEEEEEEMRETSKHSFLSSSSSSASSSKYQSFFPQHQKLWQLGTSESSQEEAAAARSYYHQAGPPLQLMDLSVGNNDNDIEADGGGGGGGGGGGSIEREHMFDKVVTPSDVGKLNRLVIPKQYAEKYFPFDTSTNEKGLLLNFEDRNGKPWRFRYSYWNSSQSYVMTKGWSRFVKEKKLDPGDIVSFQRGVGELGKDRLYIDWRRRPEVPNHPTSITPLHLQNHHQRQFPQSVRWASRLYSLPSPVSMSVSMPRNYDHLQQLNYNVHPYHNPPPHHHHLHRYHHQNQQHHHHSSIHDYNMAMNSDSGSLYYLRSSASHDQIGAASQGGEVVPMVIDSVPVVRRDKTPAKRLRLFGVNMECSIPEDEPEYPMLSSSTMASFSPHIPPPSQLRLPIAVPLPTLPGEFSKKGKSSLTFDADP